MLTTQQTLLDRSTVRRYERQSIAPEHLEFIRQAIRNTPTSYNGQQFSVIEVNDQDIKLQLEAVTSQKQFKTCATAFIFLADFNKIRVAAKAKGLDCPPVETTADGLIVATIDASLALMSALVAAQSCGYGCCPIGYARTANPVEMKRILNLPQGTFVICALTVGVPREIPDLKPKQPLNTVIFNNRYPADLGQSSPLAQALLSYDSHIQAYNQTRAGGQTTHNDWVSHILGYYNEILNHSLRTALAAQGFTLER